MSIPATELTKIKGAAVDALQGSEGQAAIRSAVSAELAGALKQLGSSQVFIQQIGPDGKASPQVYLMLSSQLLHIPNPAALSAIGGVNAASKVLQYGHDDPVWKLPISGAQPGASA